MRVGRHELCGEQHLLFLCLQEPKPEKLDDSVTARLEQMCNEVSCCQFVANAIFFLQIVADVGSCASLFFLHSSTFLL